MVISETIMEQEIMKSRNDKTQQKKPQDISKSISIFFKNTRNLLKNNKEKIKLMIPIAIISVLFMIYMITKTIVNIRDLNKETAELYNLNQFNTKLLEKDEHTKEDIKNIKTLPELINYENGIEDEIKRYNWYLSNLQSPYTNLMSHILLPSLNIWKDPFKMDIDINIVWQKFLEKNPYDDIKLIQKWSNFFKNVWNNNEFNQIESINIWDMIEKDWYFNIPISVKFIANSKRSFLLLVEKLSTTSNSTNIWLINEFIYHLRENIKKEKWANIQELQKLYNKNTNTDKSTEQQFDQDKTIWYHIYQRISNNETNKLINDNIIKKTIKDTIVCGDESDKYCYYKFRDKYRSIPSLAYTIWIEQNTNKTKDLKTFLKELPPIISINKFTFDRNTEQDISTYENIQYKWEVQMNIYGKDMTDQDVSDISTLLWKKCLWTELSTDSASKKINNTLINIWNITQVNTTNTANLRELQDIIKKISKSYDNLSNYKKTIKLFEIYRMLQDWNLCNI